MASSCGRLRVEPDVLSVKVLSTVSMAAVWRASFWSMLLTRIWAAVLPHIGGFC